ncbi:MAG: hypothetical protein KU29_13160 [Sulfurovum sp. FS06-10]|jgi:gamma-glutamylcyclotransferase (GGCT)/AIG2-like uncharacterized protein YtfP|nr:MAG: hypothetical protein KU29_13160 [Sulfurovum sp. FS06-10]
MSNIETCISFIEKQNIGSIVNYEQVEKRFSGMAVQRPTMRKSFSRLVEKKMLQRVNDGNYKIISNKRFRIFVYGSLKRKCINHGIIKNNATFISTATTVKKYAMFKAEYGNFPRLIKTSSKFAKHIYGEVYDVYSEDALVHLDKFEGIQYNRIKIKVEISSGEVETVYAYVNEHEHIPNNVVFLDKWKDKRRSIDKNDVMKKFRDKIEQQKRILSEA